MNKLSIGVLALVVGVIIGAGLMQATGSDKLGGVTIEDETFKSDVDVEGTLTSADIATTDDLTVGDDLYVVGNALYGETVETVSGANVITSVESGTTYYISTTGAAYTLPAVATAAGDVYRFVVGAAFSTNAVIGSAEGDNIEGALIVAGAVVDCNAVDFITFVADGENLGDFVELRSNGTSWFIGASGALTASKLTCTDPS